MDPSAGVFIVYMHTNQLSTETTSMCGSFSAAELGVSSVSTRLVSSVGKLISLKFLNHLLELRIFFLFTEFFLRKPTWPLLRSFLSRGSSGSSGFCHAHCPKQPQQNRIAQRQWCEPCTRDNQRSVLGKANLLLTTWAQQWLSVLG